jgi:hypothetical protein
MRPLRPLIAAGAVVGLTLVGVPAGQASVTADRAPVAPVIVAHLGSAKVTLSSTTVRAGAIEFKAVATSGDHTLQLLRLHAGYSLIQAGTDINAAFGGDTAAIGRVDDNITWLAGAEAKAGAPGFVEETLTAGHYVAIDQTGNPAPAFQTVTGTAVKRAVPATHGSITTFTYGFGTTPTTLPKSGWVRAKNQADQPHFIVLEKVKDSTTNHQVAAFVKSGMQGNPPWALRPTASMGVFSPGRSVAWKYDLPAGKYLIACFWPDRFSGMPHIAMGMWKLIHLK